MRVLIVDDEPIARRGIRRLLEQEADVEIAGEAGSGAAAVEAIATLKPDLVFLDIQMPELDGLGVVATVGAAGMPVVVFVTAFDEYAVRAFDLNAADYVLKPVDPERFRRALERARGRLGRREEAAGRLTRILASLDRARPERLVVRSAGKIELVPIADIDWIVAEDNYVRIGGSGKSWLMRETVSGIERRLDPETFVRIRRSSIVRIERIVEIRPESNGTFELTLRDGTRVTSARRFRERIERLLAE